MLVKEVEWRFLKTYPTQMDQEAVDSTQRKSTTLEAIYRAGLKQFCPRLP